VAAYSDAEAINNKIIEGLLGKAVPNLVWNRNLVKSESPVQ